MGEGKQRRRGNRGKGYNGGGGHQEREDISKWGIIMAVGGQVSTETKEKGK